jgi:uncharacterized membrane protein (UPF0136 family)
MIKIIRLHAERNQSLCLGKKMKWQSYIFLLYGIFLLVGGVMGYAKSHSTASLIMGSLSAALVLIGSAAMLKGNEWGYYLAMGVTTFLALFFSYRFYQSGKIFPPGVMALISLSIVIGLLATKWKR